MSKSSQLTTLSYFERQEYEALKIRAQYEAKRLRDQGVVLGFLVVAFLSTLAMSGIIKFDLSQFGIY
ncbi:MAG: hypothetical protein AAF939_19005 [Planctomycetota bacterium]